MAIKNASLSGKTIIVTGATNGIGFVTAMKLARMGATLIVVSRSSEKCAATVETIRRETGNPAVDYFPVDLSSQGQIRQFADQFQAKYDRLDVLVNNAGAVFISRRLSVDGLEMTWALNHLNYFLLTNLLLEILKASAPARVVNVSSNAHLNSPLDFDDLQLEQNYTPFKAYGRSKFANVFFTYELARRLQGSQVTANALHPGLVHTDIGKSASRWLGWAWRLLVTFRGGRTPEQGAETSLYLASSYAVEQTTGKYFIDQKERPSDPDTYDVENARRLWELSAQMTGL